MLDEANSSFINGVITIIRWSVYLAIASVAIRVAWALLSWIWGHIKPTSDKEELEKAKQHMRDVGY